MQGLLRIDADGPHERVLVRRHRSVHALWSELTASLLPICKGLLLGIKIPLGEKVPQLIIKRPTQWIPPVHALRRKDLRHKDSRLPR